MSGSDASESSDSSLKKQNNQEKSKKKKKEKTKEDILPPGSALDANVYATKKTIAQGLMDIALLTANASQLKHVLTKGQDGHYLYTLMIALISFSIFLQIIVGFALIFVAQLNINYKEDQRKAKIANDVATAGVFLITVVNIIISAFGISSDS